MNFFKKFQINFGKIADILFVLIIAFLIFGLPLKILANNYLDKQAQIKSHNTKYIKYDCLYYLGDKVGGGRTPVKVRQYAINNSYFTDFDKGRPIINSPFDSDEKIRQFHTDIKKYGTSKCYQISYLHFDYIIVERFYFYDYFGVK